MSIYNYAKEQYAAIGVDTDAVIKKLNSIPVSMHCWQGDDVKGFEGGGNLTGGIQSTGNHPGAAANIDELRDMIDKALAFIPGTSRLNLHATYGDIKGVERDKIEPEHFQSWIDWAGERKLSLDFNPTLFSHPKSADGLTLSHPDKGIRDFWVEHCKRCRIIAESFSNAQGNPSVVNLWIADGFKDIPVDTLTPRLRYIESLDAIYNDKRDIIDAVESKLFGIGFESYTVGSHEFYLAYVTSRNSVTDGQRLALCVDAGHFHPTEVISAKISAISMFVDQILLHVSRPVRWDSDHVVILDDELVAIAKEVARSNLLDRVHIGLDYFDGSVDRISAWTTGMRNMRKALLIALLEPYEMLQKAEWDFDFTKRLVKTEELKAMPWQAVWAEYCERYNIPTIL